LFDDIGIITSDMEGRRLKHDRLGVLSNVELSVNTGRQQPTCRNTVNKHVYNQYLPVKMSTRHYL
jgi:hypothetical protein